MGPQFIVIEIAELQQSLQKYHFFKSMNAFDEKTVYVYVSSMLMVVSCCIKRDPK